MRVLREFHDVVGRLVKRFDATVGFLEGDGVQLFFNDPIEIPDAPLRAVRLGCALREEMADLTPVWRKRGYELELGDRHRARLRHLRRGRLRGPVRLRGDRLGDEPGLTARRRGDRRADPDRATALRRDRGPGRGGAGRRVHAQGLRASGRRLQRPGRAGAPGERAGGGTRTHGTPDYKSGALPTELLRRSRHGTPSYCRTWRPSWCMRILRFTRCRALSIVFVSQPSPSAICSYDAPSR